MTELTGPIVRNVVRRDWPRRRIDIIVIGNPDGQLDLIGPLASFWPSIYRMNLSRESLHGRNEIVHYEDLLPVTDKDQTQSRPSPPGGLGVFYRLAADVGTVREYRAMNGITPFS